MNNDDIILNQLRRVNGQTKAGKFFIKCPLGTHSDSTPSLGITTNESGRYPVGTWYCFGCGKSGAWNELAQKLGLRAVDVNNKNTHTKHYLHVTELAVYQDVEEMLQVCWPKSNLVRQWPDEEWRTIPTQLLQKYGCRCIFDPAAKDYGVVMPVVVGGEMVGGVKATWEKSKVSYVTSPGPWVKESGLLGYDDLPYGQPMVLVEGPRDRWRLLREGVPAAAILGALQWTQAKANLVAAKNPPRVLLFFDGDAAGEKARDMIYTSLRKTGLEVKYVDAARLSEEAGQKIDPANCDEGTVEKVRRFCGIIC